MEDPREPQISIEATEGRRGTGTASDRLMIGLAVLALAGGALIGVSKLLPPADAETSAASPTPIPTLKATPRPQVKLENPLRTFRVDTEPLPQPRPTDTYWGGWIRVLDRVKVRLVPSDADDAFAVLRPGDVATASDDNSGLQGGDWLQIESPIRGWIHEGTGASAAVERVRPHALDDHAYVDYIAPGPHGQFLLGGSSSLGGPYFIGITEGDGTWRYLEPGEIADGISSLQAAYGPAGWIAVVNIEIASGSRPWFWQSDDGSAWRSLGPVQYTSSVGDGSMRLVGSTLGYVMTSGYRSGADASERPLIWYSADGIVWSERPVPTQIDTLVTSGIGVLGYRANQEERPTASFSRNGWDWAALDTGDMDQLIGIAGGSREFVALDRVGEVVHTWVARIEGEALVWRRELSSEGEFADAVVTSVTGASAPLAMGYERGSEASLWWSYDLDGWHRHKLPDSFGVIPHIGAESDGSYVIVGAASSPLADDPVLWASTGSPSLQPERTPFIRRSAAVSDATCRQYRQDLVDYMTSSTLVQALCHGDAPVTLTAYVASCPDCEPESGGEVTSQPAWLAQPEFGRTLRLSPIEANDYSWIDSVLAPGLRYRSAWEERWVTVTGHFDDPAARSCRYDPPQGEEQWYPGREEIIRGCRGRFVVTSVQIAR